MVSKKQIIKETRTEMTIGITSGIVGALLVLSFFAGVYALNWSIESGRNPQFIRIDKIEEEIVINQDISDVEMDDFCNWCMQDNNWGGFCNDLYGWREEICICDEWKGEGTRTCVGGRMNPKYLTKWEREELNQPIQELEQRLPFLNRTVTRFCDDIDGNGLDQFDCWGVDEKEYYSILCDNGLLELENRRPASAMEGIVA